MQVNSWFWRLTILGSISLFLARCQLISVKVSSWDPWSGCEVGVKMTWASQNFKNTFYGFLIDIFIDSAKYSRSNLSQFEFECISWNEMLNPNTSLQKNNTIYLGPYLQNNYLSNNLAPSSVVYSTYMSIIERIQEDVRSNFYYLSGFTYDLWLFLVFLLLLFAHLLWYFERCQDQKIPMSYLSGIAESLWVSISYAFFFGKRVHRSLPGRVIIICLMFTMFFVGCFYIAATVSRMINNYNYFQFIDLTEFGGDFSIYTTKGQKGYLKDLNPNLNIKELDWGPDALDQISTKLNETSSGVVGFIPQPLGDFLIKDFCDLKLKPYHQFEAYIGFGFHKNLNPAVKEQINNGILQIQEINRFDIFRNMRFFDRGASSCSNKVVDFKRTIGLWIVLSVGIIISVFMFAARKFAEYKKWIKEINIVDKNQLKKGLKLVIFEEKKRIQTALIDYFDKILVIYESKHKDIWKKLEDIVENTKSYPSEIDTKISEIDEKI